MNQPTLGAVKETASSTNSLVTPSFGVTAGDLIIAQVWLGVGTTVTYSNPTMADTFANMGSWTVLPIVNLSGGASVATFVAYAIAGATENGTVTGGWTTNTARARMEVWKLAAAEFNAAAPVVQYKPDTAAGNLTITFDAAPAATSGIWGGLAALGSGSTDLDIIEDTGFSQLAEGTTGAPGPLLNYNIQWDPDASDSTVAWTGLGSAAAGYALEIGAPLETLTFDTGPVTTQEDTVMANIVVVSSDVSSTETVTLSIGDNPGSSTLGGEVSKAMVDGSVTFTDIEIPNPGTDYTLIAEAPGHSEVESDAFDITYEPADHLDWFVPPANTQTGAVITPAPKVRALNSENVVDPNYTEIITVAVQSGPGVLGGDPTIAAAAGVSTYSDLTLDTEGTYILRATSGALTLDDSPEFEVTDSEPVPDADAGFDILPLGLGFSVRM